VTYPMRQKIEDALKIIPTVDDQLDPSEDQFETAESVLIDLVRTHGFDHSEASRIVRACFWHGWNQGYDKGQNNPRQAT
jgi:hypothetical protein